LIVRYQEELNDILGETDVVQRERLMTQENVEQDEIQIAQLQEELVRIRAAVLASEDDASISSE
ncbi:MAG: hypothetical protein GWN29_03930, partial [Gammaproteobacteria bacterium]|nr:hypothetical protein [Gammaproteobacteria bacterium]